MDKLRTVLSGREDEEQTGIMGSINEATTLDWSTRIKGFAFCFVLGILFTILASVALFLHRGLVVFATLYTFGNVLSMMR